MQLEHSYEANRDSMKHPALWQVVNDACLPHFHSAIELVLVQSGHITATLNGQPLSVAQGQLLVVPSYTVHSYQTPQSSRSIVFLIPLDYSATFHRLCQTKRFKPYVLKAEDTHFLASSMEMLLEEGFSEGSDHFLIRGVVYILLGKLLDLVPMEEIPKGSDHPDICKMLAYINQNYQKPLTLNHLASTFGYSPNRLSHILNKNVGCSIPEYINMLRARHAARLMADQNLSVTEAAMLAGFGSMRTFYRSFATCYGMSPSQYAGRLEESGVLPSESAPAPSLR